MMSRIIERVIPAVMRNRIWRRSILSPPQPHVRFPHHPTPGTSIDSTPAGDAGAEWVRSGRWKSVSTRGVIWILAGFLQASPLLRMAQQWFLPATSRAPFLLKWAFGAVAVSGTFHAVSGATTLTSASSIQGTVGEELSYQAILTTNDRGDYPFYSAIGVTPTPRDLSAIGLTMSIDGLLSGTPTRAGTFTIQISGTANTGYTGTARVTLTVAQAAPLAITAQPVDVTAIVGDSVSFSVTATGPSPTYQWLKDGSPIDGAVDAQLSLSLVQPSDAGVYTVRVAAGTDSVTSQPARLTVTIPLTPPAINSAAVSVALHTGEAFTLAPSIEGSDPLQITWSLNGGVLSGQTGRTLSYTKAAANQSGEYTLSISNEAGTAEGVVANVTITPLELESVKESSESVSIRWPSIAGRSYVMESAPGLSNPQWSEVNTVVGDGNKISRSLSPGQGQGLIRVRVLP